MDNPTFIIVDLFCGAGGTTTGFAMADNGIAKVIACVNHDPIAIKSHWINHPEVKHFEEDIRTLDLTELITITNGAMATYPNAKLILWASLECTNFSKAKGGQARDADSRTLADHLDRYVKAINPDYIQIENVVEFMSWGPLDSNGKPVSKKAGTEWMRWRKHLCSFGYRDDWKELNSADFGAYTSRNRLFGCFAKDGLPIVWPEATHGKKPATGSMFAANVEKWKAVKEVLDFDDEGISIFNRKKPLVDASLERIEAGLIKFVAGGKDVFLLQYNSTGKNGDKRQSVISTDSAARVITCQNRTGLCFIAKYYSGKLEGKVIPVTGPAGTIKTSDGQSLISCTPFILNYHHSSVCNSVEFPCPTLVCRDKLAVINPSFLAKYYGNGDNISSVEEPAGTLVTKDRFSKIQPIFIQREYKTATNTSINEPLGTIPTVPKANLVNCQPFILNPSHGGHCTGTDVPCVVIVARQDKAPLYLVQFDVDEKVSIPVYDDDSEVMIRIKRFMAMYGLSDIKMRMLKVSELLPIQGFPRDYHLAGNQTDQKKFIGNSVVPLVVKAWCEAMADRLIEERKSA
jgi:DNA (cytosine-5)-methyltransferase 1